MSMSPLFRIQRKETLEQRLKEKKKLTALRELAADKIVIGTRSTADLVLKDPIAASYHCQIRFDGGEFKLCDTGDSIGNATGTYLNGVRIVDEPVLHPGDRIALGVTTIEWPLDEPQAPGVITLHVREGAFFFAKKKRGEFESDTDEWVRSEVTFGRLPMLRALNALGIVAAICAALWLWFAPEGQATIQPNELSSAHAALFSDNPPSDPHLASAVAIAQEMGCAACHESFGQPSQAKCAACHGEVVELASAGQSHPFGWDSALECSSCHREHHGTEPAPGTLHPVDISQDCQTCHGAEFETESGLLQGLARAESLFDLAPTSGGTVLRSPSIGFESFDHGSHHRISDCAVCHLETETGEGPDFAKLTFDSCMECHSTAAEAGDRLLADWLPPTELRWDLAWHGAGVEEANCRQCHVEPYAAPLQQVELVRQTSTLFSLATRSHAHDFEVSSDPNDCATCHKAGAQRNAGRMFEERPFRHDQHLSFPAPGSPEEAEISISQCAECHLDIASNSALIAAPGAYTGPPIKSCAACHEESGTSLLQGPGVAMEPFTMEATAAFPHDLHVDVEGSCLACHTVPTEVPGPLSFLGRVETKAGAAACTDCHVRAEDDSMVAHDFLAGGGAGACDTCHAPQGTASPSGALASVFYGATDAVAAPSAFEHTLEGHQQSSCTECHGALTEGQDIHSPPESAMSCRECHARTRFHWR